MWGAVPDAATDGQMCLDPRSDGHHRFGGWSPRTCPQREREIPATPGKSRQPHERSRRGWATRVNSMWGHRVMWVPLSVAASLSCDHMIGGWMVVMGGRVQRVTWWQAVLGRCSYWFFDWKKWRICICATAASWDKLFLHGDPWMFFFIWLLKFVHLD